MSFIRRPDFIQEGNLTPEEGRATTNRDFAKALEFAQLYVKNCTNLPFCEKKAAGWLYEALSYKRDDRPIEDLIDLTAFFNEMSRLQGPYLFTEPCIPILEFLNQNQTIRELHLFDSLNEDFDYDIELVAEYIKKTKSLRILDFSIPYDHPKLSLTNGDLEIIGEALKQNTSIHEINLQRQVMCNEGLVILLNALKQNPDTKLRQMNLESNSLTDKSAVNLIDFLQTNISVQDIRFTFKQDGQRNINIISSENILKIKQLCLINRHAPNNQLPYAFMRFFESKALPAELGWYAAENLIIKKSDYLVLRQVNKSFANSEENNENLKEMKNILRRK